MANTPLQLDVDKVFTLTSPNRLNYTFTGSLTELLNRIDFSIHNEDIQTIARWNDEAYHMIACEELKKEEKYSELASRIYHHEISQKVGNLLSTDKMYYTMNDVDLEAFEKDCADINSQISELHARVQEVQVKFHEDLAAKGNLERHVGEIIAINQMQTNQMAYAPYDEGGIFDILDMEKYLAEQEQERLDEEAFEIERYGKVLTDEERAEEEAKFWKSLEN